MKNKVQFLMLSLVFSAGLAHAAEVKIGALVSGQVLAVDVKAGAAVKAGQRLLLIDDRRYQAKLKLLLAEVGLRELALADTKIELEQVQDLFDRTVIARRPLDRAKLDHDLAEQALSKAQAELTLHQAWLDYFHVKAPVAGRIKTIVPVGSTVFEENQQLLILETN